ncbi:hypothetical protein NQ318_005207 [Aromia moschata]|uniref:Uncharacterized protein n=1 Tax=Aromia moschata TaxID=1265417 RepID=A0AAV8YCX7_9CUCU|nr:hypothetical protein NQ318_005207 [Aromia moschata]
MNAGRSCSPISRKISRVAADISRYRKNVDTYGHVRGHVHLQFTAMLIAKTVVPGQEKILTG